LEWTTQNITSVAIDHGAGSGLAANGSLAVALSAPTTFTLTATGVDGTVISTVTVGWVRAPIDIQHFTASPSVLIQEGHALLQWVVANADRVEVDGLEVAASGSMSTVDLTEPGTQTHTLDAYQDSPGQQLKPAARSSIRNTILGRPRDEEGTRDKCDK
jgi:hypothetical protein